MKTENLTRKEAYKAMIDGHKVTHPSFDKGEFVYAEEALGVKSAIGYTEEKVFTKEGGES